MQKSIIECILQEMVKSKVDIKILTSFEDLTFTIGEIKYVYNFEFQNFFKIIDKGAYDLGENLKSFLNDILTDYVNSNGWQSFKHLIMSFDQLNINEQEHLKRLSQNELKHLDYNDLYNNIFIVGTNKEVSEITGIAHSLVKNIRARNKKFIINNLINLCLAKLNKSN